MVEYFVTIGSGIDDHTNILESIEHLDKTHTKDPLSMSFSSKNDFISTTTKENVFIAVIGDIYSVRKSRNSYKGASHYDNSELVYKYVVSSDNGGFERLNGDFIVFLSNAGTGKVTVATDKLAKLPGFYYITEDGKVRLSTNLQLFIHDPDFVPRFDTDYLAEFFAFQRVFGIHTPLKGVKKLPPGSSITFDLDMEKFEENSYWDPIYNPTSMKYSQFVDEFTRRISKVVAERISDTDKTGILLSGGSDSRLIAQLLSDKGDVLALHMNELKNTEADIAKEISTKTGIGFRFLRRHSDYYLDVLENTGNHENFLGWFNVDHAAGFEDELSDCDTIVTGLLADVLFRGLYLPKKSVMIPKLNKPVEFPSYEPCTTASSISQHRIQRMSYHQNLPDYFLHDRQLDSILTDNVRIDGGSFIDHGVRHESLETVLFSYYPLTNVYSSKTFAGMNRISPNWSPFLDDRLVELQLKYPIKHMIGRNIVNDVIEQLNPSLLSIPHSASGLKLSRPQPLHLFAEYTNYALELIKRSFGFSPSGDLPHATDGSWPNYQSLFESNNNFDERLYSERTDNILKGIKDIDRDAVYDLYESKCDYEDFFPLYSILASPISEEIARTS